MTSQKLNSPSVGYADQVVGDDPDGIKYGSLTGVPRRADVEVVHLHRLTALGPLRRASGLKRLSVALAYAATLKLNRIALVRTWHGSDARGDGGRVNRLSNWIINQATSAFVVVDPSTRSPRPRATTVIPFGHYRERFLGYPRSAQVAGRIVCMAPRLGWAVDRPIQAFLAAGDEDLSLRIVGEASPARTTVLERFAAVDPARVSTRIELISDGAIVMEMTAAELVVLPQTAELDDLHLVLLALSLDRPVLVPDNALTRSVAKAVGEGWVLRYSGTLAPEALEGAMKRLRAEPLAGQPDLEGRDRETTTRAYAEIFANAAKRSRRR